MYYINIRRSTKDGSVSANYSCIRYNYYENYGMLDLLELEETLPTVKGGAITRSIEIDRSQSAVFVMNINGKTLESYHTIPK